MEPMEGRWVCRRCFASNEAAATACERCGLERGADPATADPAAADAASAGAPQPQSWGAPPPKPARPLWQQLALRFWWVGLIAVIAIGGWYFSARRDESGDIANSGNLQVNELRVGDCFDLKDPEAAEIDEVEAKPCTQAHQYELFHAADMPSGDYPSDAAVNTFVDQVCIPAFASYVGMEFESSVLELAFVSPTSEAWDDGDHSVQCAVHDRNDAELTTSLKGAAR
jgi:hypothetical protein